MNDITNISRKTFPRIWLQQESTAIIPSVTKPKSSDEWVLFNIEATGKWQFCEDQVLRLSTYFPRFIYLFGIYLTRIIK
jgi:hypothetical protein